jgi:predicted ArsR family transcriptional regulator
MKVYETDERALVTSFSSTKRQILIILKREGEIDLTSLAKELKITKMGVLNHIKELEEMEIIERFHKREGVGRPRLSIKLSKNANDIFPKAYSSITTSMLDFIADNMGRNSVYDALKKRQNEVMENYHDKIGKGSLKEKVENLAKIRDQEGYMVELKTLPGDERYELLEFNCPILAVADKYHESCQVETELFSDLLDAKVETTHRTVNGDNVCRFFIKSKKL